VEINFNGLRATVLEALAAGLKRSPDVQLHLVYIPELSDPLSLADDERRSFAPIKPPVGSVAIRPDKAARLITLDCRKVAAYLLETYPAIDDPVLESSITQVWQETAGRSAYDRAQHNDELELSSLTIGGWIVSTESANSIAQRFRSAAPSHRTGGDTYWVRWFCPDHLHTMWPTLTAPQRMALLGEATWVSIDPFGQVKVYRADHPEEHESAPGNPQKASQLSRDQILAVEEVPTVRDLLERWRDQAVGVGAAIPRDAVQRVQGLVQEARELGLRGDGLTAYALLALQLPEQVRSDPDWRLAVDAVIADGLPTHDLPEHLPERFWLRWDADAANAIGHQRQTALS
jgi:Domain of unknown function (DUF4123)